MAYATDKASLEAWLRIAFPLYTRRPRDPNVVRRAVGKSGMRIRSATAIVLCTASLDLERQ